jgi:uncharacterized membrane protein
MSDLTFKQLIFKAEAMKSNYKRILSLFSCGFDIKGKVRYIKNTKDTIYSLKIYEWQSDRLWDYMNDNMTYNDLLDIANRQNIK